MVILNLLAASLLVAGVGSSLGLPTPMNASVLPAISSYSINGDNCLVSPVTEDINLSLTPLSATCDVSFGSVVQSVTGSVFVIDFSYALNSLDITIASVVSDLVGLPVYYLAIPDMITDFDVSLPSLSYWDFDGSEAEMGLIFVANDSSDRSYGYYGVLSDANVLSSVEYAQLGTGVNPIDAITDGLTAIVPLGGALADGFDAVFLDDGALTAVGMFAFILMGVGISVGITKKCFNWVTGRHGM